MTQTPILVDTGPLVGLLNERDQYHRLSKEVLADLRPPLLTCLPVVTEAAYLLKNNSPLVRKLLSSINSGFLQLLRIGADDVDAINSILAQYEDQKFQFADACLMHLAGREEIGTVFTFDHRDFSVFRIDGKKALSLLPAKGQITEK